MSGSGPVGNGLNVRNFGTDELPAGRLFKRTQSSRVIWSADETRPLSFLSSGRGLSRPSRCFQGRQIHVSAWTMWTLLSRVLHYIWT